MPEMPEVETVRRGLSPHLEGARLAHVQARRLDLRFPLPDGFSQRLTGVRVLRLDRRGKYILARLDSGEILVIHLGMTGRFTIENGGAVERPGSFALAAPADPKHAHIVFETEAGARLTFHDARRFGFMELYDEAALAAAPRFSKMGPEPLDAGFDAAYLAAAFAGRIQAVKSLLLDQTVVAGLGNIYACEALHEARISPFAPAGHLSATRLERLAPAIRNVLEAAVAAGGSTLRDFAAVSGELGYFQHSFKVYGREGEACASCGRGRVARETQAGRSTFHCRRCQR